jgi:restriction system protein
VAVPKFDVLFNPMLQAIKKLGGSASIAELDEEITNSLHLTDEDIAEPHGDRGTELQYRLAWARTYLKAFGLLDNTERGVWVLTEKGQHLDSVDPRQVTRFVRDSTRGKGTKRLAAGRSVSVPDVAEAEVAEAVLEQTWREKLLATLYALPPDAFERLTQRLLRESGFVQVKVTGRSGDGGIDGVGIVQLGGLLGFPILFQCKRYRGSVGAGAIRDFRGAMIGRADRGLVITTGTFSREARAEATRDGAPPIDLVDGEQLLDKLKELRLGVGVKMIEEVTVLPEWFTTV